MQTGNSRMAKINLNHFGTGGLLEKAGQAASDFADGNVVLDESRALRQLATWNFNLRHYHFVP